MRATAHDTGIYRSTNNRWKRRWLSFTDIAPKNRLAYHRRRWVGCIVFREGWQHECLVSCRRRSRSQAGRAAAVSSNPAGRPRLSGSGLNPTLTLSPNPFTPPSGVFLQYLPGLSCDALCRHSCPPPSLETLGSPARAGWAVPCAAPLPRRGRLRSGRE